MSFPLLVLAALGLIGATLSVFILIVFRETRRTAAFTRRLGVPRARALTLAAPPEERARPGGGGSWLERFGLRRLGLTLSRAGSMLVPIGAAESEKLSRMLRHAGFGHRDALSFFLSAKLVAALAAGVGASFWAAGTEMLGPHRLLILLAGAGGLVAGGLVPEYVLRASIASRSRKMAAALPDALDLMVMCLESGLTFERTLATVAAELAPIEANLAGEFRVMEAELRVGSDRRTVLQDFRTRSEVEGLRDLATTLLQSERYGTPLTQSMKNIAAGERLQRAARIAAQAERLPVLMTLPMLLFVVPGTMLLVAGPAFLVAIRALRSLGGG